MALSGRFYGYLNYDFAVTTGTGPNHLDVNPNRVVTFRLGRTFATRNGVVNVGGSLLQGRLPITDLTAENPFAVELPPRAESVPIAAVSSAKAASAATARMASAGPRRVASSWWEQTTISAS